jgi:hypothetical protein
VLKGDSISPPPWLIEVESGSSGITKTTQISANNNHTPIWYHRRLLWPGTGRNDWTKIHTHLKKIKPGGSTLNDHQPR